VILFLARSAVLNKRRTIDFFEMLLMSEKKILFQIVILNLMTILESSLLDQMNLFL